MTSDLISFKALLMFATYLLDNAMILFVLSKLIETKIGFLEESLVVILILSLLNFILYMTFWTFWIFLDKRFKKLYYFFDVTWRNLSIWLTISFF